jgi:adenylate cyclase
VPLPADSSAQRDGRQLTGSTASIEAAVAAAEQDGLRLHLRVRLAILAAIAVWLVVNYVPARAVPGLFAVAAFAALQVTQYALGRHYGRPIFWAGVVTVFEVALLVGVLLTPVTLPVEWPPQVQLRLVTVLYLFMYVAGTVLSYSPALVIWTGGLTAAGWSVGHLIMARLPDTLTAQGGAAMNNPGLSPTGSLALFLDPHYVSVNAWRTQTILLLLLTAVLATAVARSRSLLRRQVMDHVARANLARYFCPTVVDVLASAGPTGTGARRESVAVLFADIKGYTPASESLGAEAAMELLQGFHHHLTRVVFEHRGTLEKYIGDAVMATFGTPSPAPDDASRALRCAWQLLDETRRWSEQRVARGAPPVQIGIGIHYGEAFVGSIGDGQRLDYAVIGDSVNVASRLERLTREFDVEIVVSDDLVTQIQKEGSPVEALLSRFTRCGDVHVRGRVRPLTLWTARDQAPCGKASSRSREDFLPQSAPPVVVPA